MYHGLLVIDKPPGMTSRDVVNRAQGWFPRGTRIGHMGTLDPLATGVLVLGVGDGTKVRKPCRTWTRPIGPAFSSGPGAIPTMPTGIFRRSPMPCRRALRPWSRIARWIGDVEQVPPNYSAVKLGGRRAYDLSRRGQKIDLAGRIVRIYDHSAAALCLSRSRTGNSLRQGNVHSLAGTRSGASARLRRPYQFSPQTAHRSVHNGPGSDTGSKRRDARRLLPLSLVQP